MCHPLDVVGAVELRADERGRCLCLLPKEAEEVEARDGRDSTDVLGIAELVENRRVDPSVVEPVSGCQMTVEIPAVERSSSVMPSGS